MKLQIVGSRLGLYLSWAMTTFILFFASQSFSKCQDLEHPPELIFRGHFLTSNDLYLFALDEGNLCFKIRSPSAKWHDLEILPEMRGEISEISMDGSRLAARSKDNKIFLMKEGLKEPKFFTWTSRWGVPFGYGSGVLFPEDTKLWDFSYLSPLEDESYIDSVGQAHTVGIGVSTIFLVREDGQTIDYFDPWLPTDLSYGLCGPIRGKLRLAALSTAGSSLMAMDKYGNIFVRRYDFDMGGGDTIVFSYSYKTKTPSSSFLAWLLSPRKLPVPDWAQLPRVPGLITKKISMDRLGLGAQVRQFRVEGSMDGRTGYFELDYDFVARSPDLNQDNPPLEWRFFETGLPLEGEPIENFDDSPLDLGPGKDQKFVFDLRDKKDSHIELLDFNERCSPATMRVSFGAFEESMDLILHSTDKIRFTNHFEDENSYTQNGVVEIPSSLLENFDQLSLRQKKFLKRHFKKQRFSKVKIKIQEDKIILKTPLCLMHWTFTKG